MHRGAYVDGESGPDRIRDREQLVLARAVALDARRTTQLTFSHTTAALLWGLPLVDADDKVHVIQTTKPTGRDRGLRRHLLDLPPDERTTHLGLPVTTLERTVLDCATSLGTRAGLVIADAAFRAGADPQTCSRMLAERAGRRGVVGARAVLELTDGGAESPGESLTRHVLLRAGLPRPQTQVRVSTHLGTFWSDLGWDEWRLLIEYDGRAKYTSNGTAAESVLAERRRQDAIEEADYRVLRVTKEDLRVEDQLVQRVLRHAPSGLQLRPRSDLDHGPRRSRVG